MPSDGLMQNTRLTHRRTHTTHSRGCDPYHDVVVAAIPQTSDASLGLADVHVIEKRASVQANTELRIKETFSAGRTPRHKATLEEKKKLVQILRNFGESEILKSDL